MKIAAIVIWYNPQRVENCVSKVRSYADFIKVYIIDNSPCDNSELARQVQNAVYLPNLKNVGIAAAQNIGCKEALRDGFEWVMTMDQDSFFEEGQFDNYLREAERYSITDEKAVSFSVSMKDESKRILPLTTLIRLKAKAFLKRLSNSPTSSPIAFPAQIQPIDHPDRVFASANIIKLSVWDEIGRFDEGLFIDEVDFDFCIRLHLGGYYITRFNTVYLNHKLGNRKFTIFPKTSYHTGKRLFFIIRNKLIENKRYGCIIERNYKKEIFRYFKDYCILNLKAVYNWLIFARAFFSYKDFIKRDSTYLKLKEKGLAK